MTGFTDLPNELIVELWSKVLDPEAVQNFAVTSKKIYALGSSFIKEHNELRAGYSFIHHRQDRVGSSLVEILKALLQNPRAALYVRRFDTDGWRSRWNVPNDSETPRHRPYSEDTVELFRQSVKDSPLNLKDEISYWLTALKTGNEGAIVSLLLTILPNLHSLKLHRVRTAEDLLFDTIKRIANSRDTEALSRLTEVRLLPGDGFLSEEFDWVRTFATLPSVKAIEAWGIDRDCECRNHDFPNDSCVSECYGPDEDYDCHHDTCHERRLALLPKTSAVTRLTFIDCIINTKRPYRILEGLRALETFEYLSPHEFSAPDEIVDALLAHAKHTLRKLHLRSGRENMDYAITLADFEVMKELEIGYDLLLDNRGGKELADTLPPSIEKLHLSRLYTNFHYTVEMDVLEMTVDKAERLPNLKELTIELLQIDEGLDTGMISTMEQRCEGVGVRLSVTIGSPVTLEWCERWGRAPGFYDVRSAVTWEDIKNCYSRTLFNA